MQFVTFGNRIATENFNIGFFYKITFTDSTDVECTCIGIGANFVSFQRQEPELLFTLTLENASTVLSIDFLGGGGTDDYEELDNKPQINSVELIGNLSLSDLGIQAEITAEDPLSSSLVSGLGTAAAADTTDFATAAQGALASTAVQPADLNGYQTLIDNSHKLSADLVDDTSTTNKFATAAELQQIETNKTNILLIERLNGKTPNLINIYDLSTVKALNTDGVWNDNVYITNNNGTISINDDGTITVVGNFVAGLSFNVQLLELDNGVYYFSGCPAGGSVGATNGYFMAIRFERNGTQFLIDLGSGQNYTKQDDDTNIKLQIWVRPQTNISLTQTWTPYVVTKADYDAGFTDFKPYALSNAELTAAIQAIQAQLANS